MPASSKEFLDIQATIQCGFTLKHIRDMIKRYSQSCSKHCWDNVGINIQVLSGKSTICHTDGIFYQNVSHVIVKALCIVFQVAGNINLQNSSKSERRYQQQSPKTILTKFLNHTKRHLRYLIFYLEKKKEPENANHYTEAKRLDMLCIISWK